MQDFNKGKLKATLPDIKTQDENNRKLTRKDYNRPDVIVAKKIELDKFFKFNVIKSVPHAPWGAKIMRTTWVITEKTDNLSKTESKVKAVGAVPFICHKEKLPVGDINSNKM